MLGTAEDTAPLPPTLKATTSFDSVANKTGWQITGGCCRSKRVATDGDSDGVADRKGLQKMGLEAKSMVTSVSRTGGRPDDVGAYESNVVAEKC